MNEFEDLILEDKEFVLNLPYHLTKADMVDDLSDILTDFEFIEYKIFCVSAQILIEDYDLALQNLNFEENENSASLRLIAGAVNLSLSILELDKNQISAHLIGRLLSSNLSKIQSIVNQVKNRISTVCLCPLQPNLMPPNTNLFRTLLGHTASVNTLVVIKNESDDLILISGSSDGTIKMWDLKTGRNIANYVHNASVEKILITADGKQLISAHRHSVLESVGGTVGGVTSIFKIDFEPGILKICDLDTGKAQFIDENNLPSSFHIITKTYNNDYIVVQSHEKKFKVLDVKTGEEILVFRGHCSLPESNEDKFSSGIISGMALAGFGILDFNESPVDGSITAIPGSKNVVSSWGDGSLKIWNVETGNELFSLLGHPGSSVSTLETTIDGQLLISGSSDKTIKIWDLNTGQQAAELKGHQSYVTALAVTKDGKIIISGSSDNNIKIWNLEKKKDYTLRGHSSRINSLLITPNEENIISASNDGTIKIWSFKETYKDDENKFLPHHSGSITGIDISPDNQKVVSTSADGTVKVWDLNTGQLIDEGRNLWGIANGASVTPDGRWVISGSGTSGYIMLWSLANVGDGFGRMFGPDKVFEGHNGRVGEVVVTPDGTRVISASDDRTLQVWDLGSERKLLTLKGHENFVHNAAVTPNSKKVVSVSKDETLIVWDLSNGRLLRQLYGHTEEVCSVTVTPNGRYIISGSEDKTIIIWDIETGEELFKIEGHNNEVMDLKVFPDGGNFISVSSDKSIKIWNIYNQKLITQFIGDYPFCKCAITRDGSRVVAGDGKGYLHFLALLNHEMI